eukprot:401520-Prymnesium_polylepis.1
MLPCYRDATRTYLIGTARIVRIVQSDVHFCLAVSAFSLFHGGRMFFGVLGPPGLSSEFRPQPAQGREARRLHT